MLKNFTFQSKRLQKEIILAGKEEADGFGNHFYNIDNKSLSNAFYDACRDKGATLASPVLVSNDVTHPAFQSYIKDNDGEYLPVIGEASADTATDFWKPYLVTLAQTRCIYRAIIQYLDIDAALHSFSENIKGAEVMSDEDEKAIADIPIPTKEELEQALKEADDIIKDAKPEKTGIVSEVSQVQEDEFILSGTPDDAPIVNLDDALDDGFMPEPEEDYGSEVISFGKYKNAPKTIAEVCETDPVWFNFIISERCSLKNPDAVEQVNKAKLYVASRKENAND